MVFDFDVQDKLEFFREKTAKGAYSVIIYKEGNAILLEDGKGRVITEGKAGQDDSIIIKQAMENYNSVYIADGTYLISNIKVSYAKFKRIICDGTLKAAAEGKMLELYRCDWLYIFINQLDLDNKAYVGIDLHASNRCKVHVNALKNVPTGTFSEDDGSGLGAQNYEKCGIRVKGIYGVSIAAHNRIEVASTWSGAKGAWGTAVLLTSTTSTSSNRANRNVIMPVYLNGFTTGVHIENGGRNVILFPELSNNNVGLKIGSNSNNTVIYGDGFIENCDIGIDNQNEVLIIGEIGFTGTTTPISREEDAFRIYQKDLVLYFDGSLIRHKPKNNRDGLIIYADNVAPTTLNAIFGIYDPTKSPTYPLAVFKYSDGSYLLRLGTDWCPAVFTEVYRGDYGGNFANFTPPTPKAQGHMFFAEDTNATAPAKRLYISLDGSTWSYVDLV